MKKYIEAKKIYDVIEEEIQITRQRLLETPSNTDGKSLNPMFIRYSSQLDTLVHVNEMIYDECDDGE